MLCPWKRLSLCLFLLYAATGRADTSSTHAIVFFLQPYPDSINADRDGTLAIFDDFIDGVFITYAGQIRASDRNGQVAFHRKHDEDSLTLAICKEPTPIFMLSNTIHHWHIREGVPFEIYRIIWSEDKELKIPFISIKKQAVAAPFDIPLDGAVLVIDPADVTVREGCYELTKKTDNLVVPTVYIKRDNDKVAAALGALN